MSWFAEFSEKAENILNTIDKNAAKALNKRSNQKSSYADDTSICLDMSSAISENNPSELGNSLVNQSNVDPKEPFTVAANGQPDSLAVKSEFVNDYLRSEMLQNEIHSLNNEISLLLNRVKLEEQRSRDLSTKLSISEEKNVKLEQQLTKLSSRSNGMFDATNFTEREEQRVQKTGSGDQPHETNVQEYYDKQIEELLREKSTLKETLQGKEDEIILLKSRLSQKTYCFSADELQSRLRALTITLVEKQSAMESLMQEKNNLLNKLNHLQKQYEEALGILQQSRINMNDTDDVKALIPVYSSNGSFSRHLKKLYTTLMHVSRENRLSLRGLSAWKLLLIIYIIFMHGLVFLLLYSNTPESTDVQTKD